MKIGLFLAGLAMPWLVSCGGGPVKPYENASELSTISSEENRLWVQAREFDKAIGKLKSVYDDPQTTAYLQSIMDKLYPEFAGKIRVKIVNTPVLNAFALPNGSIYFHLGMLARMDNEAQLAAVLAHEGAHFIQKHGLQQTRNVKSSTAFAMAAALAGVPILPQVLAASSIYGFSRELEREADQIAFERMKQAGYDTAQASKVFEHLQAEVKALEIDEPYMFSSHPQLEERIESFKALHEKEGVSGRIAEAEFLQRTEALRIACLKSDLAMNRYKSVILVLNHADTQKRYKPFTYYYLGEAYRQRGDKDDKQNAVYAYERAISAAPDFTPSYRALGLLYMKDKEYDKARTYFEKYLATAEEGRSKAYVKQYLKQIESMGAQ